eukprot:COSAG01_NODE_3543_length_5955_cov_37.899607_9_plen_63_part_00
MVYRTSSPSVRLRPSSKMMTTAGMAMLQMISAASSSSLPHHAGSRLCDTGADGDHGIDRHQN